MVKFLINRPIAVTMGFIAILVLGALATTYIPVSLMPNINIPEITVQVSRQNVPARELENTVVGPLRRHLLNLSHLEDISSETRDEKSTITLKFGYGTNVDFAFIEVNEKIDRAMSQLPRDVDRPKVIKASATDIPVFFLDLTLKNEGVNAASSENKKVVQEETHTSAANLNKESYTRKENQLYPVSQKFTELSSFATQVIRKRIEQLPEVAMVDMSGLVYPELLIIPDLNKMESLKISLDQLESHIRRSNVNFGNLLIKDGQYQYNVRFNSSLTNKREIEDLYIKSDLRLFQLKEVAEVIEHPQKQKGMVRSNGKDAISMAIIKQSDARMGKLEEELEKLLGHFHNDYPEIDFTITRDQTKLLKQSINNLGQDLFWGATLAFLVMFFFLKDLKSPLLIGITIPSSLVVSLLLFHIAGISINVISLSGLVLGIGMMVDNSIIVIDNITQHRLKTGLLDESCILGANEVFFPMLSSSLTTCAVFLPLIFMSGITGALFYDEALAVTIGTFVSLAVSMAIIPVYYKLFYRRKSRFSEKWLSKLNGANYEAIYEKSFKWIMRHQVATWSVILLVAIAGTLIFFDLPKTRLPDITKNEVILEIDWNDKINVMENGLRTEKLTASIQDLIDQQIAYIGEQQFLLDSKNSISSSEGFVYFKVKDPKNLALVQQSIKEKITQEYPNATIHFTDAETIFSLIFSEKEAPLVAKLRPTKDFGPRRNELLQSSLKMMQDDLKEIEVPPIPWQEHIVLKTDPVKMATYDISLEALYAKIQTAFNEKQVFLITDNQEFTPVILGGKPHLISEILSSTYITNNHGKIYPIRDLISESRDKDLKIIKAGQEGEYFPVPMQVTEKESEGIMEKIKSSLKQLGHFEADFSGTVFSNKIMIKELSIILLISLALLYFILAAQFESFSLPLIILLEVPIDIFGAFIFLKICGAGINIMSLIGLVVMSGIIINDSILKIDTINKLMLEGNSLLKSMMLGGQKRLKPILMTSITTILAMVPLLFTSGLGAELQRPLALTLIGGMTFGTIISLYFIPLCYYYLKKI